MLNHVLVPLDFSALSEEALAYAGHLLQSSGKLTLLHVVDTPQRAFVPTQGRVGHIEEALAEGRSYLKHIKNELAPQNIRIQTEVRLGKPAETILEAAEELGIDAIVMSTHGRTGFDRFVFGSIALKVLSAATCPVFMIPGKRPQP